MELPNQERALSKESVLKVFRGEQTEQEQHEIPHEDGDTLTYDQFFTNFMYPNRPVVITHLVSKWNASQKWRQEQSSHSLPNLQNLKDTYGNSQVNVAHCETKQYTDQKRELMKFSKYIDYWQSLHNNSPLDPKSKFNSLSIEDNPVFKILPKELLHFILEHKNKNLLYLKDWHLAKEHPNPPFYSLPLFFSDDWINTFWDTCVFQPDGRIVIDPDTQTSSTTKKDDYRFVYMGPKGTWTPFHADVFRSYSWSSNVVGKKLWILFSPDQEKLFQDKFGYCVYDVTEVDLAVFPDFRRAKPLIVVQEEGETIFVPSGWFHQVYNLEDTISINHNWGNGCNIDMFWNYLQKEHENITKSIEDIKPNVTEDEFEDQCQLIMRSNTGIDYLTFYLLLFLIAERELNAGSNLRNAKELTELSGPELGCLFNLHKIEKIMKPLVEERAIQIAFRTYILRSEHHEFCLALSDLMNTLRKQIT